MRHRVRPAAMNKFSRLLLHQNETLVPIDYETAGQHFQLNNYPLEVLRAQALLIGVVQLVKAAVERTEERGDEKTIWRMFQRKRCNRTHMQLQNVQEPLEVIKVIKDRGN